MRKNELEVGMILFHPKRKEFIQIKEITNSKENIPTAQYFVCSGWCEFFGDAQTTIVRQVLYQTELEECFYLDAISSEF